MPHQLTNFKYLATDYHIAKLHIQTINENKNSKITGEIYVICPVAMWSFVLNEQDPFKIPKMKSTYKASSASVDIKLRIVWFESDIVIKFFAKNCCVSHMT